jgi:16S rRNA (adenine1518-N6/adenine1519-N6)-dimethyltransferase
MGRLLPLKKRFGQHFLSDRSLLRRIVQFAQVGPKDTVFEIGPGAGSLTTELAAACSRVIAVEIDKDLISGLRDRMPANVEIIEGDALEIDFPPGRFRLAGNLPYNGPS